MDDFHERLKMHIRNSAYDYKSLSLEIGQGERYISNLLGTKSDPAFTTVLRICSVLGITPNQLTGVDDSFSVASTDQEKRLVTMHAEKLLTSVANEAHRQLAKRGVRPSVDDVVVWWHQQNGVLSNFDNLSRHVDLYHSPNTPEQIPAPYQTGDESLASVSFGIRNAEHLQYLFNTFSKRLCDEVSFAHVETKQKNNPTLTIEEIDVQLPGRNFPARFKYMRLLLPVVDTGGHEYVLNFSKALD